MKFFYIFLILINIITFIAFTLDKVKAIRNSWRIREFVLLGLCFLGGATGGLISMVIFKHKLSKKIFTIGVSFMIILNRLVEFYLLNRILNLI